MGTSFYPRAAKIRVMQLLDNYKSLKKHPSFYQP